jgi:hypothetical protein
VYDKAARHLEADTSSKTERGERKATVAEDYRRPCVRQRERFYTNILRTGKELTRAQRGGLVGFIAAGFARSKSGASDEVGFIGRERRRAHSVLFGRANGEKLAQASERNSDRPDQNRCVNESRE